LETGVAELAFRRRDLRSLGGGLRNHVAIVVHNYRRRLGLAESEPQYDDMERRLAPATAIAAPTITLEGGANGAPHPDPAAYAGKFAGNYQHRLVSGGVGHNLPQEAPSSFARPSPRSPMPERVVGHV
jgi:hypothetical protein